MIMSLFFIPPSLKRYSSLMAIQTSYFHLLPIILLQVRLFYHSGIVKLMSNDPLWQTLDVLDIHLFSQPLPHILSYYFHVFVVKFNLSQIITLLMYFIELAVPFGLLIPFFRRASALILILFQLAIILTGNYGYFNFLVIGLLMIPFFIVRSNNVFEIPTYKSVVFNAFNSFELSKLRLFFYKIFPAFLLIVVLINSLFIISSPKSTPPLFATIFYRIKLFNPYGLFANMTTNQTKFNIRLSHDRNQWVDLDLKYFDDQGYPEMRFVQPYHPRIRWQLWFKFIYLDMYPHWYMTFIELIARNPKHLTSIVASDQDLTVNYNFVELCYQDIIFNLNDTNYVHRYWAPQFGKACHIYDANNNQLYKRKPIL